MQTEFATTTSTNQQRHDWPAIRGEVSIYLLTIIAGIVAFAAVEDAKLRREEIAVVKQVHVQLDAYAHLTRDALRHLDSHQRTGKPYLDVPAELSSHIQERQP